VKRLLFSAALLLSTISLCAQTKPVAPGDARVGPRFDVLDAAYGAVGDGSHDDTGAIQAAFNACWKNGVQPYGGVVEFPGNHSYVISSTINAYDSCRFEGIVGAQSAQQPPTIVWNGPAAGTVYNTTTFTTAANVQSVTLKHNPAASDTLTLNGCVITFVASGATGNQVNIRGSAAATATALYTMLNASSNTDLKKSQPYTNPSPGVVQTAFQNNGRGPNNTTYVETLSTNDPDAIAVSTVFYAPSSPSGGRPPAQRYTITFPTANTLRVGDWVLIQGNSTKAGYGINNVVAQVASASSSSFTVVVPFAPPQLGTFTDSGTVTTINVGIAFDSWARYEQEVKDIVINSRGGIAANRNLGVALYFGARTDAGTRIYNTWAQGAAIADYYFAAGGINTEFDKGWRSDGGAALGNIYWRVSSAWDNFGLANGTISVNSTTPSGAQVMLDNQACNYGTVRVTSRDIDHEIDSSLAPGFGVYTLLDCPTTNLPQFYLDFEGGSMWAPGATNAPSIAMSPANDTALNLSVLNERMSNGTGHPVFLGLPSLTRYSLAGGAGLIPLLTYAPSLDSMGLGGSIGAYAAPTQFLGDVNVGQMWQYGIKASQFLYSDTAFAALPNATTLFAGQILAPPAYWNGANSKRYALDVVYQTGTTGTPNGGHTTCTGAARTNTLTCSSAIDLSAGQRISIGTDAYKQIAQVNDTVPNAAIVTLTSRLASTYSPATTLTFSPPVLAYEMQLPTKSSAAPTTLAWAQGDTEQNSAARSNGVAAWVNVAAGTPGTWAGIPLGDSNGRIAASQIADTTGSGNVVLATAPTVSGLTDTGTTRLNNVAIGGTCSGCSGVSLRTAQAFCTGTAQSSSTLVMFGAGSATQSCTSPVGEESVAQLLMTTAGTLSGFAVRCAHSGVSASSGVFSIWDLPSGSAMSGRDSGVNTGLTVTYGTTQANTTLFDAIHTFVYARGDLLRIQFTTQTGERLGDCEASFNY
jgi:hypothetical protein